MTVGVKYRNYYRSAPLKLLLHLKIENGVAVAPLGDYMIWYDINNQNTR